MQLNRKAIKHLHISVLPPDGRVRVSAPEKMTDTAIRMAVISRLPWIKKQQQGFAEQPRQTERELVGGESHYLWGRRYRLELTERTGRHEITRQGNSKLLLLVNPGTSRDNKARVLDDFYRHEMKQSITELLVYWQPLLGVEAAGWGVKKMKTKWGSCNIQSRHIWLNLELAKKPPECLEYILVHELVHLLERHHNDRFRQYMDRYLPDWQERRTLLNSGPLSYEGWEY
ncbi:M48 family metallopeptidase [Oceanisphaera arctica]|uniref:Metal-dependent hydrolase n=1 Tax=Oceanisphaera arctica TaxID=641510 RepID=A0A2P5TQG3_9GAMM|nr:SprT family zinc-dependent metalloprotease [Oceanisphaera arctica]PPL17999.1 metal-dependent hydrolase [Oceanisphaera arctica]GHA09106.1 metal-dependent hydrolase [Oceanisphaera arctica]